MAVQDQILTAQLKVATLTLANITALQNGALSVSWDVAIKGNRSVLAVQNRYSLGDTSSATFQLAYACLNGFVGQFAGGPIDPNAQNPGVVIDVTVPFATLILNKTENNLIDAGGGNWYLPYLDNTNQPIGNGIVPVSVLTNGNSIPASGFDATFTPPRIYGFSGNYSQSITITCI